MSKAMKILIGAFALSLAFNFLTLGYVVGTRVGATHKPTPMVHAPLIRGFLAATPDEALEELRMKLRQARRDNRAEMRTITHTQREIDTLLRANEIDTDALSRAFKQLMMSSQHIQHTTQDLLIEVAEKTPQSDRVKIIEQSRKHRKRHSRYDQ